MGKEKRPFCCHQNFVPKGLSAPALGLYTCIKTLKYIPGPCVRWAFTGPGFALPVAIVAKCEEKIFLAQKNFIWRNKWRKKILLPKNWHHFGCFMSLNHQLTSWITCLKSVADQLIHDDNNSPHCLQLLKRVKLFFFFVFLFCFFWHNQLLLTFVNLWSITAYIGNSHFLSGSVG